MQVRGHDVDLLSRDDRLCQTTEHFVTTAALWYSLCSVDAAHNAGLTDATQRETEVMGQCMTIVSV
jgi:hypothetical protein